ncbi:PQQ-dependent sugar dehydrogenase, partial [Kaarinaea lacus]
MSRGNPLVDFHSKLIGVLILGTVISGCGGSGGGSAPQQTPTVNQAPDLSISISTSQTQVGSAIDLSATVADDGLPNNSLDTNWRILEPPNANAQFSDASSTQTSLTFYTSGTFIIEASVSDSEFTTSRTTTITVEAVNQIPVANAGEDQNVTLPNNQVTLSGAYTDDELPGLPYSFLWELVEPQNATVTINSTNSLTTDVIVSQAGDYVFRLTVNDGELAGSDTVTVQVSNPIVGTFPRPTNLTCIAPNLTALRPNKITIEPAFPELPHLGEVVAMKQAPGDFQHWYALLPQGRIVEFVNNTQTNTFTDFLNLETQVRYDTGGELGLLGMAFHPDYQNNGEVYVHYTVEEVEKVKGNDVTRLRSVISRFTKVNDVWTEEIILKVNQPELVNNGGNLDFDHNGHLLISLGDGGSDNDALGMAQDPTALLGSMLRIDVDNDIPYAIPTDNPFAGNNLCNDPETVNNANACPEIFAYGLRKPATWSVDSAINTVWLGDSGPNSRAEINIIENGNNYGWNTMEGIQCNPTIDPACDKNGFTLPVFDYEYSNAAQNIVGGYVYRGGSLAFLYGSYLFADTATGKILGIKSDSNQYITEELLDTDLLIYGFARSYNGDLYVLNPTPGIEAKGNNIWKIVPDLTGTEPGQVASSLSQTGCVDPSAPTQPSVAMISYDVINPLWTDGAEKQRFFAIPDGTTINITATGDLEFPVGSVLMKHFILNNQFIETRLLMHHPEGWLGYSYEWQYDNNSNPVDAVLLDTGKSKVVGGQTWHYPSRQDCLDCHTAEVGRAIGPEVLQLNREYTFTENGIYTSNQLLSYEQ